MPTEPVFGSYVVPFAPGILLKVTLSVLDCHWIVHMPVPPAVVAVNVALPPTHTVWGPAVIEIVGSTQPMVTEAVAGPTVVDPNEAVAELVKVPSGHAEKFVWYKSVMELLAGISYS